MYCTLRIDMENISPAVAKSRLENYSVKPGAHEAILLNRLRFRWMFSPDLLSRLHNTCRCNSPMNKIVKTPLFHEHTTATYH